MRTKSSQQYFDFSEQSSLKVVQEYRNKFKKISIILDQNPQILTLAHKDWGKLLSSSGKAGAYSKDLRIMPLALALQSCVTTLSY